MPAPEEFRSELLRATAMVGAIGADCVCLLFVGLVAGRLLDERLGTSPIGLVGGTILGLALGAYTSFRLVARVFRSNV